jgi:hypothetical protein
MRALVVICAVGFLACAAMAQQGEFSGFGGVTHNDSPGDGAKGATGGGFGFSGGYFWKSNFLFQGEFNYERVSGANGETYAFGPEYIFKLKNDKFNPFLRADFDIVHGGNETKPGFGLGGGVRVAGGKNWGIRPEFKFVKAVDIPVFEVFDGGVYYDFGNKK